MPRTIRVSLLLSYVFILLLPAPAAMAGGGGGGCLTPIRDAKTNKVTIKRWCFQTQIARIKTGEKVTWVSRDLDEHLIAGLNYSWPNAIQKRVLHQGDVVSLRFDEAGVYPYFCPLHRGMIGTVVVGNGKSRDIAAPTALTNALSPSEPESSSPVDILLVTVPPTLAIGLAIAVQRRRARDRGALGTPNANSVTFER